MAAIYDRLTGMVLQCRLFWVQTLTSSASSVAQTRMSTRCLTARTTIAVSTALRTTLPKRAPARRALGLINLWPTPAGLTAVWAEDNNREAIFSALKRKEAHSTSGVRIKVRLFGGWDFTADMLTRADWVRTAYATGATMGATCRHRRRKLPALPCGR